MAKIQTIGVGNYIRNPRKNIQSGGVRIPEVLRIAENNGNSFTCYPVKDSKTVPVTVDTTRYLQIPIDTDVQQVTI